MTSPGQTEGFTGLYRSTNAGTTWAQVSGNQTCPIGYTNMLPLAKAIGAIRAVSNTLYAGTDGGLFISADLGDCWQQYSGSTLTDYYEKIEVVPSATSDVKLLAIIYDWNAPSEVSQRALREFDPKTNSLSAPITTWTCKSTSLHVAPALNSTPVTWYITTACGDVFSGTLSMPTSMQQLPNMTHCKVDLFTGCFLSLALDTGANTPLLMAQGKVFRLQLGDWWRAIYP